MPVMATRCAVPSRRLHRLGAEVSDILLMTSLLALVFTYSNCGGSSLPEYTQLDITEETIIEETEKTQSELDEESLTTNEDVGDFRATDNTVQQTDATSVGQEDSANEPKSMLNLEPESQPAQDLNGQDSGLESTENSLSRLSAESQIPAQLDSPLDGQRGAPVLNQGNSDTPGQQSARANVLPPETQPEEVPPAQTHAPSTDDPIEIIHPKGETGTEEEENVVRDALASEDNKPQVSLPDQVASSQQPIMTGEPKQYQPEPAPIKAEPVVPSTSGESRVSQPQVGFEPSNNPLNQDANLPSNLNSESVQNPIASASTRSSTGDATGGQLGSPQERVSEVQSLRLETPNEVSEQETEVVEMSNLQ